MESLVDVGRATHGIAILITNSSRFWRPPQRSDVNDAAFRVHEGRRLGGTLKWPAGVAPGSIRGREAPVILNADYDLEWRRWNRGDSRVALGGDAFLALGLLFRARRQPQQRAPFRRRAREH